MNNVSKFGINRLVSSGIYKAAFPLHDVSQIPKMKRLKVYSGVDKREGLAFLNLHVFLSNIKITYCTTINSLTARKNQTVLFTSGSQA